MRRRAVNKRAKPRMQNLGRLKVLGRRVDARLRVLRIAQSETRKDSPAHRAFEKKEARAANVLFNKAVKKQKPKKTGKAQPKKKTGKAHLRKKNPMRLNKAGTHAVRRALKRLGK